MADLTANGVIEYKLENGQNKVPLKAGAIEVFKTAMLNYDSTGYVVNGSDTSGDSFAGFALDYLNQAAGGSNGDYEVSVIPAKSGRIMQDVAIVDNVTQANIRAKVYVEDTATVALGATSTNDVEVGEIHAIKGQNLVDIHLV